MKFILGQKIGMSQVFNERGKVTPVTVIKAGPCFIIKIKEKKKDGYNAIQIGFGAKKKLTKPSQGQINKDTSASDKRFKWIREFRPGGGKATDAKQGGEIKASLFKEGDLVRISGTSKARGFQGVVKRHGFKGFPASHGTKHGLRAPGSIGSAFPQRVFKGLRMAGRMGGVRKTVKNIKVVSIDDKNDLLVVKGAVPGRKETLLEITKQT